MSSSFLEGFASYSLYQLGLNDVDRLAWQEYPVQLFSQRHNAFQVDGFAIHQYEVLDQGLSCFYVVFHLSWK